MASFNTDVDFNESRGVEINIIGWVFTGIAITTVGLKLFARGHMGKNLGWDDFFIFCLMPSLSDWGDTRPPWLLKRAWMGMLQLQSGR